VRELENVIERAMILASGPTLSVADLDFGRRLAMTPSSGLPLAATADGGSAEGGRSLYRRLSEQERGEIVAAVEGAQGNIAHAARTLGINRSTLYYRMRKHGLEHLLPTKDDVPGSLDGASNG
jgi:two-component system response regulator AtoC